MDHLSRIVLFTGLLLAVQGQLSAQVGKAKKADPAALRAKLIQGQYIEGKVTKADPGGDDHQLAIVFVHEVRTPNADGYKKFVEVANRYNLALEKRSTSLEDIKKMQQEVKLARAGAFVVEETPVPFQFKAPAKTVFVRTLIDPPQGQPKVKGDPRLPGYVADFKDVAPEKFVRVYLDRRKLKPGVKTDDSTVYPAAMIVLIPSTDPVDDLKPVPLR